MIVVIKMALIRQLQAAHPLLARQCVDGVGLFTQSPVSAGGMLRFMKEIQIGTVLLVSAG